jgi:hypothetical protein
MLVGVEEEDVENMEQLGVLMLVGVEEEDTENWNSLV